MVERPSWGLDAGPAFFQHPIVEAGFEFIFWLALELFGEIVGSGKPWWVKLLASLGCLAAMIAVLAAIVLLGWAIMRAGGVV